MAKTTKEELRLLEEVGRWAGTAAALKEHLAYAIKTLKSLQSSHTEGCAYKPGSNELTCSCGLHFETPRAWTVDEALAALHEPIVYRMLAPPFTVSYKKGCGCLTGCKSIDCTNL